jgi:hypothetical protein
MDLLVMAKARRPMTLEARAGAVKEMATFEPAVRAAKKYEHLPRRSETWPMERCLLFVRASKVITKT